MELSAFSKISETKLWNNDSPYQTGENDDAELDTYDLASLKSF